MQVNLAIYKASILDNKQLLSNIIVREATQVPYNSRIAFLDRRYSYTYIFYPNFPTVLCIIAIAKPALLNNIKSKQGML